MSPRVDPRTLGCCGWEAGWGPAVGPTRRPSRLRSFIGLGCSVKFENSPHPHVSGTYPLVPHTPDHSSEERRSGAPVLTAGVFRTFWLLVLLESNLMRYGFHRVGGLLSYLPHFYTFCGTGIGRIGGQRWNISQGAAETHLLRSQILFLSCFILTTSPRSFLNLHLKLKPAMMTVTIFPMCLALC